MTTKTSTVYYSTLVYQRNTHDSNPDHRQLWPSHGLKVLLRTRDGTSNPHYKRQIAACENATTVLSGTFTSFVAMRNRAKLVYFHTVQQAVHEEEAFGDIIATFVTQDGYVGGWVSKADSRASTGYLQKVRAAQVMVSGPTFLGELRETLRMIRKPAAALQDGIRRHLAEVELRNRENRKRYFNKQPKKYARNLSKIASGLWLENAFGWVPLLHDIDGARKAYDSLFEREDRIIKISAGGHDAKDVSGPPVALGMQAGFISWIFSERKIEHVTVRYRGAVKAQAATTCADVGARFGFTPSEFIPTAWELLPWSFLVDYFANIGDILSALVTDTSQVAWTNRSVINKLDKKSSIVLNEAAILAIIDVGIRKKISVLWSPAISRWKHSTVTRAPSAVPSPELRFTYPGSTGRLLNVAALLDQVGLSVHPQRLSGRNYRL